MGGLAVDLTQSNPALFLSFGSGARDLSNSGVKRLRLINIGMNTYSATVKLMVKGRSLFARTEVRAMTSSEARWLLWAQFGFHSIVIGPSLNKF